MKRSRQVATTVALAIGFTAAPALAQSRAWSVCGGNAFNTCASVDVTVSGSNVTLRVWNLSGFFGSYANTVFTGIGFENVGSAAGVSGSLAMSGPMRSSDTPGQWVISNNTQIGGGVNLDMVSTVPQGGSVDNGIASGCADPSQLPGGSNQLWQNPCAMPSGLSDPGWIVMTFQITGTWDLASTYLLVKGQNGPNGDSTECITGGSQQNCADFGVVPEPITIALLGTGLAGVGGAGFLKRRRKHGEPT